MLMCVVMAEESHTHHMGPYDMQMAWLYLCTW